MKGYPETMVAESDSANISKILTFNVENDKTVPEYEVEKIFQIRQTVQKLWPKFILYVNVTQ